MQNIHPKDFHFGEWNMERCRVNLLCKKKWILYFVSQGDVLIPVI